MPKREGKMGGGGSPATSTINESPLPDYGASYLGEIALRPSGIL